MGGSGLRGPGRDKERGWNGCPGLSAQLRPSGRQPALPGHILVFAHWHTSPCTRYLLAPPTKMPPSHGGGSYPVSRAGGPVTWTGDLAAPGPGTSCRPSERRCPAFPAPTGGSRAHSLVSSGLSFCLSATLETSKAGPDHPAQPVTPPLFLAWASGVPPEGGGAPCSHRAGGPACGLLAAQLVSWSCVFSIQSLASLGDTLNLKLSCISPPRPASWNYFKIITTFIFCFYRCHLDTPPASTVGRKPTSLPAGVQGPLPLGRLPVGRL